MKRKKELAVLLAVLLLGGCNITKQAENENTDIDTIVAYSFPSAAIDIDKLMNSGDRSVIAEGNIIELGDKEWNTLISFISDIQNSEPALPKEKGKTEFAFSVSFGEENHSIAFKRRSDGRYVSIDSRSEYRLDDSITDISDIYYGDKMQATDGDSVISAVTNPEKCLIGLSAECDEPKTPDEYLEAARKVVKPWLDSLKNEEGAYRLKGYTFTDRLSENREFHGDGYINGGREFVCYVGFDTPTEEEDTVFYASGTYDTFYHYYFGPGILARFRWENGVCTLIDYDDAFAMLTSDKLKTGLYGIGDDENNYATFYDFMNDKENINNWLNEGYRSRLCSFRVSHNVMMLSNGKIIFVDIGDSGRLDSNGVFITGEMHKYFYDTEGNEKYSSPVDYIDGIGAVSMTYRDGFPIVFDDYNHDGNPDYTLRISSDEKGSTYDVRCMDINGTPWEDNKEVYIYGEFDESIRLQVYDGGSIVIPIEDENGSKKFVQSGLFKDKSNTSHEDVTEGDTLHYRMYSQRFYLPEQLRCYSNEDKEIICYFWNNTDKAVTLSSNYEIERKNGEVWEKVGSYKGESTTVNAEVCGEISFDISDIQWADKALYRIKTTADGKTVYGGFYYGTENIASLEISSEKYPSNTSSMDFVVKNCGMTEVYPKCALYRNGEKLCDLADVGSISAGSEKLVTVTDGDIGELFKAGEYTLEAAANGVSFVGKAEVVEVSPERRYYFPDKVTVETTLGGLSVSLKNNIWNESSAVIKNISEAQVLKNGLWYSTLYTYENVGDYRDNLEIPFGNTTNITLVDNSSYIDLTRKYYDSLISGDYADILDDEDYKKISSMSFEEFLLENLNVAEVNKGDLCRITLTLGENGNGSEYVYFIMP